MYISIEIPIRLCMNHFLHLFICPQQMHPYLVYNRKYRCIGTYTFWLDLVIRIAKVSLLIVVIYNDLTFYTFHL